MAVLLWKTKRKQAVGKYFFTFTPLYIILGYPLYNWQKKYNSGDVNISKEDYSAFSSDEGEIKNHYRPHLILLISTMWAIP